MRRRGSGQAGSAVIESTMVMVLVLTLFLGVLQVGFALHVRNVLTSAAAEGARHGAVADGSLPAAEDRAREVATTALSADSVETVVARRRVSDGVAFVEVQISGRLPVLGPWGRGGRIQVAGTALAEGR